MATLTFEAREAALAALLEVTRSIQLLDERGTVLATFPVNRTEPAAQTVELRSFTITPEGAQGGDGLVTVYSSGDPATSDGSATGWAQQGGKRDPFADYDEG
jgi:hypothetical protein